MYNFDVDIISDFLSSFETEKILILGMPEELILDKILSYVRKNEIQLYLVESEKEICDLFQKQINSKVNLNNNIKIFQEDILKYLPKLNNFDTIFINGDSNWYTVYNELKTIKKTNSTFPFVFVCNNKYLQKYRDSYIDPIKIPNEFKKAFTKDLKIVFDKTGKKSYIIIHDGLYHALDENTSKNGVQTAINDFLNENSGLNFLEISYLQGISLIYHASKNSEVKINKIIEKHNEIKYNTKKFPEKLEKDILLNNILGIKKQKNDVKWKNNISEYEDIENNYKTSVIDNIESKINLQETKLQYAEIKLLNKENIIKEKENELLVKNELINDKNIELAVKNDEIKSKDEKLDLLNLNLLTKEKKLKSTQNRLMNLENNFLDVKKELSFTKKQLADANYFNINFNDVMSKSLSGFDENFLTIQNELIDVKKQLLELNKKIELTDNTLEIEYIKNNNKLSKKIISHLSYFCLAVKSKPEDLLTNIRLYKTLKNTGSFDINYYLNKYPDIPNSKWCKYFSPELHYVCKGFDEKREFNKNIQNNKSKQELIAILKK